MAYSLNMIQSGIEKGPKNIYVFGTMSLCRTFTTACWGTDRTVVSVSKYIVVVGAMIFQFYNKARF
jgi:hypothetical protein